jgi:hypothetical protein
MLVWNSMHASSTAERSASPSAEGPSAAPAAGSMLGRNLLATDLRASAGHTLNQSMVVQLTSEGNLQAAQQQAGLW